MHTVVPNTAIAGQTVICLTLPSIFAALISPNRRLRNCQMVMVPHARACCEQLA
jgi:hypothetical protein